MAKKVKPEPIEITGDKKLDAIIAQIRLRVEEQKAKAAK
jgi:hypothetical protein